MSVHTLTCHQWDGAARGHKHWHGQDVENRHLLNHYNWVITECQVMQLTQTLFAYMQIVSLPTGLAKWDALFSLVDPNLLLVTLDFIKV